MEDYNHMEEQESDPFGPATDLVITLFSFIFLVGVLGMAFSLFVKLSTDPKEEEEITENPADVVIVLNSVADGEQYFKRGQAELDKNSVVALLNKMKPLQEQFFKSRGKMIIHVTGHASPEPFGEVSSNFELALDRAMAVARLLNDQMGIPYECLRVKSVGRSKSMTLTKWLEDNPKQNTRNWDSDYRSKREAEKIEWKKRDLDWDKAYVEGNTELGKGMEAERRVVLTTEITNNPICRAASKDGPGPINPFKEKRMRRNREKKRVDKKDVSPEIPGRFITTRTTNEEVGEEEILKDNDF